jgi:hypothetical protein
LKAAEPDLESQPVNTAVFRNCGDDVPASLAIESEDAISLPTALQKSPACYAQCHALATPKAYHSPLLVMMLSPTFVSPQNDARSVRMIRTFAPQAPEARLLGVR